MSRAHDFFVTERIHVEVGHWVVQKMFTWLKRQAKCVDLFQLVKQVDFLPLNGSEEGYHQVLSPPLHSAPVHGLSPSECPITSVVLVRVPPYINSLHQSTRLHQISPIRVPSLHKFPPSRVSLYINYPHQSHPYMRFPHQSALLDQMSPSEFHFTSNILFSVLPHISCPHRSATLHQLSSLEFPLTSIATIRVPPYINCLLQIGSWISGCMLRYSVPRGA